MRFVFRNPELTLAIKKPRNAATSIGITGALYRFGKVNRVLVVCPLSIVGVWQQEFESFAAYPYSLTVLSGSSTKKKEMLSVVPDEGLQIIVVNYESTWRIQDAIEEFARRQLLLGEEVAHQHAAEHRDHGAGGQGGDRE